MSADLDVAAVKTACDLVVAAAPDPDAAKVAFLKVWLLGGLGVDDLLDDLELHAVQAGLARGMELTTCELFECAGHPERAAHVRAAVEQGRAAWIESVASVVRLYDVSVARREVA